ncbi:MAG: rod shape-determining protein MreC [Bacteroidales bacterium]|nr:rod shape-determining protein MreC [Bacteroidales bacterium]
MARRGSLYVRYATAAVFIILEIAALSMLKRASTLQDIWLNRFSHNVMAFNWGGVTRLRSYFSLRQQNDILAGRNYELFKELQHYKEMERELQAMRKLDSSGFKSRFNYIPAEITAMGTNSRHNYVILDKGSEDGVKKHSAIITPNGVVGMIYSVDKHYSYGLSLLNDKLSVSTRIGREGLVAPMTWDGKSTNMAILKNIPLHLTVAEGDTVLTSGTSSVYPADIPIGVTMGSRLIDGAVNIVDVKLFVDFATLRYVIIAENPEREYLEEMQQ